MNNVIYFWGGTYSNWYPCKFIANLRPFTEPVEWNCAEQFMMASKAWYFADLDSLDAIMRSRDPRIQKSLGRKVKGFNAEEWKEVARDLVYPGVYAKFAQNYELGDELKASVGYVIAEASPYDKIWGIGMGNEEAKKCKSPLEWDGTNWLGQVLMKVRDDLDEKIHLFDKVDWTKYENDHLEYS